MARYSHSGGVEYHKFVQRTSARLQFGEIFLFLAGRAVASAAGTTNMSRDSWRSRGRFSTRVSLRSCRAVSPQLWPNCVMIARAADEQSTQIMAIHNPWESRALRASGLDRKRAILSQFLRKLKSLLARNHVAVAHQTAERLLDEEITLSTETPYKCERYHRSQPEDLANL